MAPARKALQTSGTSTGSNTPRSQTKALRPSFKDLSVKPKAKETADTELQQRLDIEALKEEVGCFLFVKMYTHKAISVISRLCNHRLQTAA